MAILTADKAFAHLHNHSCYSLLDGAQSPKDMAQRAAEIGLTGMALTDHGRMGGLVEFYIECKKVGVKPIMGIEAYITGFGRSRTERMNYSAMTKEFRGTPKYEAMNHHLILLAKDKAGYDNLCALSTESFRSGYYYKPRIDYELLREHHEGLICSSACVVGELATRFLNNDIDGAYRAAEWFKGLFGDDYYIEIMNHGLGIELAVMRPLRQLADDLGIKTIVTNDCHYTRAEDHKIQKTLMLLAMHKSWADSDVSGSFFGDDRDELGQGAVSDSDSGGEEDPIFETPPTLYIRDWDEMVEANRVEGGEDGRVEQELRNTNEIVEKCTFEMPIIDPDDTSAYYLPTYPIKTDVQYEDYAKDDYRIPDYIADACVAKRRELGHDVHQLSDWLPGDKLEALRFLMWICERNLDRLVKPKIEARGEPLPDSFWIENPPEGFHITHSHNSPDEKWIKGKLAEGLGPDDIMQLYRDRLAYEVSIIVEKEFVNYFLIVQSYIGYTRASDSQVGPGRGSGAGALINYLSGITSVDPLPNDLMFERFLAINRRGFPDIDSDFGSDWRDNHLWPHLREIYGKANSAGVAAYQYFWGKQAIKSAARVLFDCSRDRNITTQAREEGKRTSVSLANNLADLIDNKPKLDLRTELDGSNPMLTDLIATDRRYQQIIDLALILQGRISGEGIHASAYIISPHPIVDTMPLMVSKEERDNSQAKGTPVDNYLIQFDGRVTQDQLGYVKLDLLCINDLEVITQTLNTVERVYGAKIDIENIPLDNKAAYDLIAEGHNVGIFQFDGSPVAGRLLVESKADNISDWAAVSALNRPGSLQMNFHLQWVDGKLHPEHVHYFTPAAEKYLGNTYGTVAFQEQLMLLSQDKSVSGITAGQSDEMRKILAHKDKAKIEYILGIIRAAAQKNGVPKEVVEQFCDMAVAAGSYSFNKSHALAYAIISYRGAFLKSLFPECYLSSLCQLKPQMKGKDKIADYIDEARQLGVEVLPPHVNYSNIGFDVPRPGVIAYGLNRIKGVGKSADPIVEERNANGPFKDFSDFMTRVPKEVGKSALMPLIQYGALDGLGWSRKAMVEAIDQVIEFRKSYFASKARRESLAIDLFALDSDDGGQDDVVLTPPFDTEYNERQLLAQEKKYLGTYLSGSPEDYSKLSRFREEKAMDAGWAAHRKEAQEAARRSGTLREPPRPIHVGDIDSMPDGTLVELVCMVSDPISKNKPNPRMFKSGKGCSIAIQDWGILEESRKGFSPRLYKSRLTVFSRTLATTILPAAGDLIKVVGRVNVDSSGDWPNSVIVDKLDIIQEDSRLLSTMSRDELVELQREYDEQVAKVTDPSSDIYLVPALVFPSVERKEAFLSCGDIAKFRGVGHALVTADGDKTAPETHNLRQTVGMVRLAQSYGATVSKVRLPKAQSAIDRLAIMRSASSQGK